MFAQTYSHNGKAERSFTLTKNLCMRSSKINLQVVIQFSMVEPVVF
jgi:hypothetical protein